MMESTPPHHPTYQVTVSDAAIHAIITSIFSTQVVSSINTPTQNKGFNNRIYYIRSHDLTVDKPASQDFHYVLKVSGTNFGPDKTRNEICCLALLQHFCEDVPVPKVFAWSEDGSIINKINGLSSGTNGALDLAYEQATLGGDEPKSIRPWMLLSHLPGEPLSKEDLENPHIAGVIKEIALNIVSWRYKLPEFSRFGNFDFANMSNLSGSDGQRVAHIRVSKVLLCTEIPSNDLSTRLDYYKARIENEIDKLKTSEIFKPNREELTTLLEGFVGEKLPHLRIMNEAPTQPVFAQYDLCPRNILVAHEPGLHLTGIVDFEFAGMFPAEEEFTNIKVSSQGDWPNELEDLLEQELALQEELLHKSKIKDDSFKQACVLIDIANNIAPWWIASEKDTAELAKAKEKVLKGLKQLT